MRLFIALAFVGSTAGGLAVQPAAPDSRSIGHMLFDDRLGALVFVEANRRTEGQRLWRMDGPGWRLIDAAGPSVRELEAVAYDAVRKRLVVHGGMVADGGDTSLADLWEFDGTRWSKPAAQGPGARDHHTMVYDIGRRRMVLFGGRVTRDRLGTDTWEYDGTTWLRFDVPGPGGRAHVPLAYDTGHQRVLLFGGMDQQHRATSDLWAWNGASWQQQVAGNGPPPRTHHRMAFDRRSGTLVVFGGLRGRAAYGDTWLWDGVRWTEAPAQEDGPAKRSGHVMAWDPARERVVMFGGGDFDGKVSHHYDDLWSWTGRRWERIR